MNRLPAIHPGEFLSEILDEFGVSQAAFARRIGVSPMQISHVINGQRRVNADLALLFGKAFGQSPEYWVNLQSAFDLKVAAKEMGPKLKTVRKMEAA
jgi:antitoxin HigA-1